MIDVVLKGVLEEIGSLVVILRLWRVFKVSDNSHDSVSISTLTQHCQIIEELSAGAQEQMEPLQERMEDLEMECGELRRTVEELKKQQQQQQGANGA